MENATITNHSQLSARIMFLKAEQLRHEEEIKYEIKELASTYSPFSILKSSIHDLLFDKDVQFDLANVGLKMGANYIIDKVLGKNHSLRGFLSALMVEKISAAFIQKNMTKIISTVGNLFHSNSKKEVDLEQEEADIEI